MRSRASTSTYQDQINKVTNMRDNFKDRCTLGVAEGRDFAETHLLMSFLLSTHGFAFNPPSNTQWQ